MTRRTREGRGLKLQTTHSHNEMSGTLPTWHVYKIPNISLELGGVDHAYSSSTWNAEARGMLAIEYSLGVHSELQTSLSYNVRPYLKKKVQNPHKGGEIKLGSIMDTFVHQTVF